MVLANAFGLTTAIMWVLCALFVLIFPVFSWTVTGWWLMGADISGLSSYMLNWNNFIWGGLTLVVSMWVTGWVFGWSWEWLSKKR